VIDVVEKVVDHRPLGKLTGEIDAAGDGAAGVARIVGAVRIAMDVHEDIALDPRVSAVEIEVIVRGAVEDVVDDLENRPGPLAAGKIDGVVEAPGVTEIVVAENSAAAGENSVDAMKALGTRRRRITRENAVLND